MSSKYRIYLITTCLPIMGMSLYSATTAQAGFEWNPPSKAEKTIIEQEAITPEPVI